RPVRCKDKPRLWKFTLQLAERRARRNVVSAMAIEQKNLFRPEVHDGTRKIDEQLNVRHLTYTHRALEKQMMRRMSRPKRRETKNLAWAFPLHSGGDGGDDVGVGCQWEVRSVLLERAQRQHHNFVRQFQFFYVGPGKICEQHRFNGLISDANREVWQLFPAGESQPRSGQRASSPLHSRLSAILPRSPCRPNAHWCSRTCR